METVFLHENGHVAGLDHSSDPNAVMYPSYQTARCSLGTDDQAGIAALYWARREDVSRKRPAPVVL